MKSLLAIAAGAVITAQPLVSEDVLEPSVANEVNHALSLAPTNAPSCGAAAERWAFSFTNGLSRSAIAVALVSAQRRDGRWLSGTNDVTRLAVKILEGSL